MTDLLPSPATLLVPVWYGGPPDEIALPFPRTHYEVEHQGERTQVRVAVSKAIVYDGIGPAEVIDPAQRVHTTSLAQPV